MTAFPSPRAPAVSTPSTTLSVCLDSARDVCGRFPRSMTDLSLFPSPYGDFNPLFAATTPYLRTSLATTHLRCNDAYDDEGLELGGNRLC